jgi:hypothetical protein
MKKRKMAEVPVEENAAHSLARLEQNGPTAHSKHAVLP